MKKGSLKNTGRLLVCAALALSLAPALGAAQLETEIDEAVIEVGDTTSLKVKMTGDPGDVKPMKYPSVPGLRIEYSGMERSFEYINGKSWSGVKLIFMVTALRKGSYRIPSFVFQRGGRRMESREVSLTVVAGGSGATENGEESSDAGDIKSSVELSSGSAYVGQPIIMRYYLMTSGIHATVHRFNEHPQTRGFAIKIIDDPAHNREGGVKGGYEKAHLATFALIPAGSGAYRVVADRPRFPWRRLCVSAATISSVSIFPACPDPGIFPLTQSLSPSWLCRPRGSRRIFREISAASPSRQSTRRIRSRCMRRRR